MDNPVPGPSSSILDAHCLLFCVELHGVVDAFPPHAGRLDAAEGHREGAHQPTVHPHGANLKFLQRVLGRV